MTKTNPSTMRVASPATAPDLPEAQASDMTERTAAELRQLCRKTGETFDTSLTEAQARDRIAALKDLH